MSVKVDGTFVGPCWHCKCQMWLPQELYDAAKRGADKITFYCSYGHPQVFSKGESDLDVMRRERDRLKQQLAEKEDHAAMLDRLLTQERKDGMELRKKATQAKKRAAAGVCPHCKRTFRQMAAHMKHQHPEFVASEVH